MRAAVRNGIGTTALNDRPSGLENSAFSNDAVWPRPGPKKSPNGTATAGVGGAVPEHLEPQRAQHLRRPVADGDPHPADHARALDVGQRQGLTGADRVEGRPFAPRGSRARPAQERPRGFPGWPTAGRAAGTRTALARSRRLQSPASQPTTQLFAPLPPIHAPYATNVSSADRDGPAIVHQSRGRTARRAHQTPERSQRRALGLPPVRIAPRGTAVPPTPRRFRGWSKGLPTDASSLSSCEAETRQGRAEPRAAFQTRRFRLSPRSKTPLRCRQATTTLAWRHGRRSRAGTRRPAPRGTT